MAPRSIDRHSRKWPSGTRLDPAGMAWCSEILEELRDSTSEVGHHIPKVQDILGGQLDAIYERADDVHSSAGGVEKHHSAGAGLNPLADLGLNLAWPITGGDYLSYLLIIVSRMTP
jgi:hypothetical protein